MTVQSMSGMGGMGGMGGTGGTQHSCKISMLWNWATVDACFLSHSWHIHSHGAFAGFCIGVILLVVLLEFFRYAARRFDRYLIDQAQENASLVAQGAAPADASGSLNDKEQQVTQPAAVPATSFRPSVVQQLIRALLHTLQFATAYWIMLLAMYFNGYVIICIILGAFIGSFIFQWERLDVRGRGTASSSNVPEATGCCG